MNLIVNHSAHRIIRTALSIAPSRMDRDKHAPVPRLIVGSTPRCHEIRVPTGNPLYDVGSHKVWIARIPPTSFLPSESLTLFGGVTRDLLGEHITQNTFETSDEFSNTRIYTALCCCSLSAGSKHWDPLFLYIQAQWPPPSSSCLSNNDQQIVILWPTSIARTHELYPNLSSYILSFELHMNIHPLTST